MRQQATLLSILWFYAFILMPLTPTWAQDVTLPQGGDIEAPLIRHDPPSQSSPAGRALEILAVISDNKKVDEAYLFYRIQGNTEYFSLEMRTQGDDLYSATIPKVDVVEPGIEYYIQASDKEGNVVLRGFSFEPLMLMVSPFVPELEGKEFAESTREDLVLKTETSKSKPWYKKWWVWTVAGAVVVGAAVAAGGSGGGGGGAGTTTGSATITAPTP